jgi:hypothetical protein
MIYQEFPERRVPAEPDRIPPPPIVDSVQVNAG